MAPHPATAAERMAQARHEFEEAMARGVSIPELRRIKIAERQALRTRAAASVAIRTADMMIDNDAAAQPDFLRFDAEWMMRD